MVDYRILGLTFGAENGSWKVLPTNYFGWFTNHFQLHLKWNTGIGYIENKFHEIPKITSKSEEKVPFFNVFGYMVFFHSTIPSNSFISAVFYKKNSLYTQRSIFLTKIGGETKFLCPNHPTRTDRTQPTEWIQRNPPTNPIHPLYITNLITSDHILM